MRVKGRRGGENRMVSGALVEVVEMAQAGEGTSEEPVLDEPVLNVDSGDGGGGSVSGGAESDRSDGAPGVRMRDASSAPHLYEELRQLAGRFLRRERAGHTLQATALVHEAFVRLMEAGQDEFRDDEHYVASAARTMRHVLVDHARSRQTVKRGGDVCLAPLSEDVAAPDGLEERVSVIELDRALFALADHHGRAASAVELRVFAGLTMEQLAVVLQVSRKTAAADLRYGRAWLSVALERGDYAV